MKYETTSPKLEYTVIEPETVYIDSTFQSYNYEETVTSNVKKHVLTTAVVITFGLLFQLDATPKQEIIGKSKVRNYSSTTSYKVDNQSSYDKSLINVYSERIDPDQLDILSKLMGSMHLKGNETPDDFIGPDYEV